MTCETCKYYHFDGELDWCRIMSFSAEYLQICEDYERK